MSWHSPSTALATTTTTTTTTAAPAPAPAANMPRWGSTFQLWARQNNLAVKGARYNFLSLSGGTYFIPFERRRELYECLKAGLDAKVPSFLVECRPEDKTQAYRLIVDFDADAESLDEVEDAEWASLLRCFFATVAEVFACEVKAVLCRADSKLRSKDGVKVRKSGLHIIFPELYVTDAEALGLRDLCIRRVREQRVLEACPILRLQRLEELFDDSIYEANGFRMIENHKASCCADCARKRRGKNHEAQRAARSRGEPAPKDVYWRFDDCERCHGAGYIYEGRPYRPSCCVSWDGVLRELVMNDEELERLKDKIYMFERLSVCVEPGTPKTPLRDGVVLPVIETSSSRKRGGGGAASSVAPRKGVVGGSKTASGWTYLPASTEGYAELSDAIFEMYLHPSFVRDPQRQEPQLVVPHAIADMKRSEDGFCLIVNSISSDCMNKRRVATSPEHSQHSRSRVYFVITRSREVAESSGIPDAYISQRCHCQKSYGGVSCKSYKSPRRQLPAEVVALLWPPTQQHTLSLQLHRDHEDEVDAAIVAACEEAEKEWEARQAHSRRRDDAAAKPITDPLVLKNIPELRDISLLHLMIQGRGEFFRSVSLSGVEAAENNALEADLERREAGEAAEAAAAARG